MRFVLIFCVSLLLLMLGGVCCVFAKAPTTPRILFTSNRDGNREVYMMNPDGSEQVNLTQHPADDQQAVWSPTGDKILFVSDRRGTRDLYLMNPDGSNIRRVFKRKIEAWKIEPTWSPDGKQFAYMYKDWPRLKFGLYLGRFGEEDVELIGGGLSPAWSPEGSEIACRSDNPVGTFIAFINVRTRNREQLLPQKVLPWQESPSWSAAGDRLAFAGNRHPIPVILDRELHRIWNDKQAIYIVNRDGTDLRQLVDEAGPYAQSPELSPDGEEVLYTQEINWAFQIFKLDVNSRVRTQLTRSGQNTDADWFDPAYAFALPVSPQPELLTTTWGEQKKE